MKIFRILLDLDEVLTDFVGGACRRWGLSREEVESCWTRGEWDLVPPLSAALAARGMLPDYVPPGENLTVDQFWDRLNGSEDFWLYLEPLPWAPEILRLVRSYGVDWHIVSAPSRCNSSYSGKVKWLKNYFGSAFTQFALTPHKEIFAQPGVVLIDDRDANVEAFCRAGGEAIVFPRHLNSMAARGTDPVSYVAEKLDVLLSRP